MLIEADNHLALMALMFAIVGAASWAERFAWVRAVSVPVVVILVPLLLSNLRLIPTEAPSYGFVSQYFVMAAIPLLLFKADLRMIFAETGRLIIVFVIAAGGSLFGVIAAFFLVPVGEIGAQAAATIGGGYIGGGMNFFAVAKVVELTDPTTIGVVLGAEASVALVYLMLLSVMPAFAWFARWDRPGVPGQESDQEPQGVLAESRPDLTHMALALGLSLVVCAAGTAIASLAGFPRFSILAITLIAILIANLFTKQMRALKGDFSLGMLLLYVFFVVFGAGVDVVTMLKQAPLLILFSVIAILVHFSVVFGLGRLFGFSAREVAIASNACVLGPPTAAALAARSGWHELVTPGILCGIFGYMIGNFLGAGVFELLS